MQTLGDRNTYTPTDVPQVRSHCGRSLNRPEGRDRVADLKTSLNNPDAALTRRTELESICLCLKQKRKTTDALLIEKSKNIAQRR